MAGSNNYITTNSLFEQNDAVVVWCKILLLKNNIYNMKLKLTNCMAVLFAAMSVVSCKNDSTKEEQKDTTSMASEPKVKEEAVSYTADTITANGYVVYDESKEGKRPAVLIVHEWWGLTDYPRKRAKQLAEMGYVAMAVDMYGGGKTAEDPTTAGTLATPFYKDPKLTKSRLDAALAKLKTYPQVDTSKIAAIGYCYGGFVVLNAAKQGADLKGVVSFHGNLSGVQPNKDLLKAKILVCHGEADNFVPAAEVDAFKKGMDSIKADYTFKTYPGATHAFTNPGADAKAEKYKMPIKYNPAADSASWNDMKAFFGKIF
jgi:dienelactone hydrolase